MIIRLASGLMCALNPLLNASIVALESDATLDVALPTDVDTPVETHVCAAALAAHAAVRELAISAA